jgi:hypothetical protein
MNLTGIISIAGKPGLFKVVAQGKNNLIVESLEDGKKIPAYTSDRVSALEDISIYTYDEDASLVSIFDAIYTKQNGELAPSHKEDKNVLINYLLEILPNYDQERVYFSDIKKIFQWYNLLHSSGNISMEEKEEVKAEDIENEANIEKPKKTTRKKKVETTVE